MIIPCEQFAKSNALSGVRQLLLFKEAIRLALTYNQIGALLHRESAIAGCCGAAGPRPGYSGAALIQPAPAGEKENSVSMRADAA